MTWSWGEVRVMGVSEGRIGMFLRMSGVEICIRFCEEYRRVSDRVQSMNKSTHRDCFDIHCTNLALHMFETQKVVNLPFEIDHARGHAHFDRA